MELCNLYAVPFLLPSFVIFLNTQNLSSTLTFTCSLPSLTLMCVRRCACVTVWQEEDSFVELLLFFHLYVGFGDQIRASSLHSKCFTH